MATLAAIGGNFTSSSSWGVVDSTSLLNSQVNSVSISTLWVSSSTFTPGAITIDGIGVKPSYRASSVSGTFSVRLYNTTDSVAVTNTTVTINVSDIPELINAYDGGWIFLKFGSSVLLEVAKNYRVEATCSTGNPLNLYRDGTANNISRFLRTTTTQAPASGDALYVCGEWTSAATYSAIAITNENTATTSFDSMEIGSKGKFAWANSASTNYYLKISNDLKVGFSGIYECGTSGSPCDSTSTFTLEFVASGAASKTFHALQGCTVEVFGSEKTEWAMLASDAAIAATTLTTDVSTGWKSGDEIGIAPTSSTTTQSEKRVLSGDASGTSVTITAGLTYAHTGTGLIKAEIINLTRNVKVIGASTSNTYYILVRTSNFSWKNVEHKFIGSNTANKNGIELGPYPNASIVVEGCSFHEGHASATFLKTQAGFSTAYSGIDIFDCVAYGSSGHINISSSTATDSDIYVDGFIGIAATSFTITVGEETAQLDNITIAGTTGFFGFSISDPSPRTKNCSNLFTHSCSNGFQLTMLGITGVTTLNSFKSYLCGQYGILIAGMQNFILKNWDVRGHSIAGLAINQSARMSSCVFYNFIANSLSPVTQGAGFSGGAGGSASNILFNNATFSGVSANSIDINLANQGLYEIALNNSTLSAATPVSIASTLDQETKVGISKWGGSSNSHRTYRKNGLLTYDSSIYNTSPASQRMTPSSASYKLLSSLIKVPVASGATATIKVKVRESVVGDGTDYNGNRIRLILIPNSCADSTYQENYTVCATATSSSEGAWEELSFTTATMDENTVLNFYIDCDGTTGWVNWDSVSIT